MKQFLHVGCGPQRKTHIKGFSSWDELRYDIDPAVEPDFIGSLTDMAQVRSASVDAVYSSHNIEHLYPHEVPLAVREFHRVLREDGFVVIVCPDLQSVGMELAKGRLLEPLYESSAGPISAIDILYGHRQWLAQGNMYMAHKSGFTYPVLSDVFREAGFAATYGGAIAESYALWMLAFKAPTSAQAMEDAGRIFLP